MIGVSSKRIDEKIKKCRQLLSPAKVILCLEELFRASGDGMVAYTLGHEYEKIGDSDSAIRHYEKAESLFKDREYKNMARSAINNLKIEAILSEKKRAEIKRQRLGKT